MELSMILLYFNFSKCLVHTVYRHLTRWIERSRGDFCLPRVVFLEKMKADWIQSCWKGFGRSMSSPKAVGSEGMKNWVKPRGGLAWLEEGQCMLECPAFSTEYKRLPRTHSFPKVNCYGPVCFPSNIGKNESCKHPLKRLAFEFLCVCKWLMWKVKPI